MWHPDSDDVFISDHMFSIVDDEKEYYIYGSQLEQWDSTDEQLGLLKNYDPVKGINYDTEKDFCDSLKEVSDAVDSVTETGRIRKLSNKMYSISGRGRGEFKDYHTYIVSYFGHGVIYVEMILYKDPEYLTEKEKRDVFSYLIFDYEKDFWKK